MSDVPPPVDGITEDQPNNAEEQAISEEQVAEQVQQMIDNEKGQEVSPEIKKRIKFIILVLVGIPYAAFMCWCLFLMSVLPSASGDFDHLISIGKISGLIGSVVLLGISGLGLMHISQQKEIQPMKKLLSIARILGVFGPGIALGFIVPIMIAAEPLLSMTIVEPIDPEDFVAPLPVTFSLEPAVEILNRRGLSALSYSWDFNEDGEKDETTTKPFATAVYDRASLVNVVARISLNDGSQRRVTHRFSIPNETFRVTPLRPIVDEPVFFNVDHLLDDPVEGQEPVTIEEVQWDFESDGNIDEVTSDMKVSKTFLRLGPTKVSAVVLYTNKSQKRYAKQIEIFEPLPPPFDISIETKPEYLVSPPPFAVQFQVVTDEPLRDVKWDFGDGKEAVGEKQIRTFKSRGEFVVSAQARAKSGDIANISKVVRIVEELRIPDLEFNGTPDINKLNKGVIEGEVPLTLNLEPTTSLPLVEFFWEAPNASKVGSTEGQLLAIYRRPGNYNLFLLAQEPEGGAMRRVYKVRVLPQSSSVSIRMRPEEGVAPLTVQFDASETRVTNEDITGFEWLFGDEGDNATPKPGSAAMIHTYTEAGTYEVQMQVRTTKGNIYKDSKTIVVRPPFLDACFTASRISGKAPLGVTFDQTCTTGNPASFEWDFGDGSVTDEENPIHVFEEPGRYTVQLNLRDSTGSIRTKTLQITAQ